MTGQRPTSPRWSPSPGAQRPPSAWTAPGGPSPRLRPYVPRPTLTSPHISRRVLLAGAAMIAATALTVGIIIATNHPSPPPPPAATPKPSPTLSTPVRPDPRAQARLRLLLPAGYPPGTCNPGGVTSTTTAATLCGPNTDPGGPASATYTLVRDKPTLSAAMDDVVHSATPVICPPNILSPGAWHRVENPTVTMGMVFCGIRAGVPLVAWTNEPELLLCVTKGALDGPPLDQLFTWWTSHS